MALWQTMNENAEKLRELKDNLEAAQELNKEILAKEPTIAHPLDDAVKEARRRFKCIAEGNPRPRVE